MDRAGTLREPTITAASRVTAESAHEVTNCSNSDNPRCSYRERDSVNNDPQRDMDGQHTHNGNDQTHQPSEDGRQSQDPHVVTDGDLTGQRMVPSTVGQPDEQARTMKPDRTMLPSETLDDMETIIGGRTYRDRN